MVIDRDVARPCRGLGPVLAGRDLISGQGGGMGLRCHCLYHYDVGAFELSRLATVLHGSSFFDALISLLIEARLGDYRLCLRLSMLGSDAAISKYVP